MSRFHVVIPYQYVIMPDMPPLQPRDTWLSNQEFQTRAEPQNDWQRWCQPSSWSGSTLDVKKGGHKRVQNFRDVEMVE